MGSILGNQQEVNRAMLDEFTIQAGVEMYTQLPGYYDFRGFDLSIGSDLAVIPNRIYEGFAKPPWLTRKHHLFSEKMHKKLFKAVSEIPLNDKKEEFKQERPFRRLSKIPIPKKRSGISGMHFVDYGEGAGHFLHLQDTFTRYLMITSVGPKKDKGTNR